MRVIQIERFGGPEVLVPGERPLPEPGRGEVRVAVCASSTNPIDTKIRSGAAGGLIDALPAVLHGDVAGYIDAVGESVRDFKVGDRVCGLAGGVASIPGALAEFMRVDAAGLAHVPDAVTLETAGLLPVAGLTAHGLVRTRAVVSPGQRVLVHAAAGGVGHLAVQLARQAGAEVFATVSARRRAAASVLGVSLIEYEHEPVADYVRRCTGGRGFDVVIDTVGGETLETSFTAAAPGGVVVTTAARSTRNLAGMHEKGLTLHVEFVLRPLREHDPSARRRQGQALSELLARLAAGELQLLTDTRRFGFAQAGDSHALLEAGSVVGKLGLTGWHADPGSRRSQARETPRGAT